MAAEDENTENAEQPKEEAPAPEGSGHAVPTEEAKDIASEVEDAPLEAIQEAQEAPGGKQAPQPESVEPGGEGHAVPSEEAMEIAGVAEDAPLEAAQEAEDRAAEASAASERGGD